MASVLPRLFKDKLPDFNFGTNSGLACSPTITAAVLRSLTIAGQKHGFTSVLDGRFKGGYITRHYGQPENNIHAIQLEICQSFYLNEWCPFDYRFDLASRV